MTTFLPTNGKNTINFIQKTEEEDEEENRRSIRWVNLIFLPFNPTWKLLVLFAVLLKCIFGPLSAVYTINCSDFIDKNDILSLLKNCYNYVCDVIYIIDTFLYIVHRQVKDEAGRREHLPKNYFLLFLDIMALIPYFTLWSSNACHPRQFYPNILAFNEVLIAYRVVQYFSLTLSHFSVKLFIGNAILFLLYINFFTCLILLISSERVCTNCHDGIYEWQYSIKTKINASKNTFDTTIHLYASGLVMAITVHRLVDHTRPATYGEFVYCIILMSIGYLIIVFVILPKFFAESVLRLRQICTFHSKANRIIEETKRNNPSPSACKTVEKFYSLIWTYRSGVTSMPDIIEDLPEYLKLNIKLDLIWPVIYHSPTFRRTSPAYKRWLCSHIGLHYKLPGENLFVGPNGHTHIYYIKTGTVQLISTEDRTSAVLSMTGGTILGDISFYTPQLHRNAKVRCLTYCEVFYISRANILKSLYKFPEDRKLIVESARQRIKHARTLYNCKSNIKGLDRKEDEGLAYIKKRWWEIQRDYKTSHISAEEANYHCPKFLGQLVLNTSVQLQKKSMFARVEFPWILAPYSLFGDVWNQIVLATVHLVLIFLPPVKASTNEGDKLPILFKYFQCFTDFIFVADIFVSILTAVERNGRTVTSVMSIFFERCKTTYFILDLLSTPWIEYFVTLLGMPHYYEIVQFNRLLKAYVLFVNKYQKKWNKQKDPLTHITLMIGLINFVCGFVLGYFFFMVIKFVPDLSYYYFFGKICSYMKTKGSDECIPDGVISILNGWLFEIIYPEHQPKTIDDVIAGLLLMVLFFSMNIYTRTKFMAAFYLKYRRYINYYYYVSNLRNHFLRNNIHPNLLRRLERYLVCHWKFYHGQDILHPNLLTEVPYDIYSKIHGEIAEKIIGGSEVMKGANMGLIKELAHKARFLILPNKCTLNAFGVHPKNVMWIVKGTVRCDFYLNGKTESEYLKDGSTISMVTMLLNKACLRTFIADTDCEVLFLPKTDFFTIVKRYPNEQFYIETVEQEFLPMFEEISQSYIQENRTQLRRLRDDLFYANRRSVFRKSGLNMKSLKKKLHIFVEYRTDPESRFIRVWLPFRLVTIIISIVISSIQGTGGAEMRHYLIRIGYGLDIISTMDIILKMALPYYDENGLIITNWRKCALHYITRGFAMDFLGAMPWNFYLKELLEGESQNYIQIIHTFFEFAHLYLVTGYFNYLADIPSANFVMLMLVKWQIVVVLIMLGLSHYLIDRCIEIRWDDSYRLVGMSRQNNCWLPSYLKLDEIPTSTQLQIVFAESLILSQCGLLMINLGKFHVDDEQIQMTIYFLCMGIMFWYIMSYCKTLLILHYRGNTIFQHSLSQLRKFLESERIEKEFIHKSLNHFIYVWKRTKGVNIKALMNDRLGAVFRQDMTFFFCKRTLALVDTLLNGGEPLERLLASNINQIHFLPNEDIIRENELSHYIYILHRGKIIVSKNGKKLATLTKGAIIGQLDGRNVRPIHITATTDDYVDVLYLSLKQFQDIINDEIRENIADNPQSALDYMATKQVFLENPFNTIEYIMFKDAKIIKLPWMKNAVSPEESVWYSRWLCLVWLCGPVTTAALVLLIEALPNVDVIEVFYLNISLDILHVVNLVMEYYSMEIAVNGKKCVKKYIRLNKLFRWRFYLDTVSLIVPWIGMVADISTKLQLFKLLRIHSVCLFQQQFCQSFKSSAALLIVKFILVTLLLHAFTCGWIMIACKYKPYDKFPINVPGLPENISLVTDIDQWTYPDNRKEGCIRCLTYQNNNKTGTGFVVPTEWYADYLIAFTYIIIIQTHTNLDAIVPLTIYDMYYRIFITFVLYLVEMYITGICISTVYTKIQEVYYYDYQVSYLIKYLRENGLSSTLLTSVVKYTRLLWQRQRGSWLPELTQLAPECLREDILSSLYMYHLETTPIFKKLPLYFLRQLGARLNRIVIFPGNFIINEGDIHPCIYFIHDGEVEKWQNDSRGVFKMAFLLTRNSYFGLIPGLFPNIPYKYAYFTRTVVDLVYLCYDDWNDLLDSYPDIKREIYEEANIYKNKIGQIRPRAT